MRRSSPWPKSISNEFDQLDLLCRGLMSRLSVSAVPIRLFAVLPLSCVLTIGISRRSLFSSERPPMHRELDSPSPQTTAPTSAPLPSFVLSSTLSKATESHPEALVSLKSRFAITND